MRAVQRRFGQRINMACGFGHMFDGNLHLNILAEDEDVSLREELEEFVYDFVRRYIHVLYVCMY